MNKILTDNCFWKRTGCYVFFHVTRLYLICKLYSLGESSLRAEKFFCMFIIIWLLTLPLLQKESNKHEINRKSLNILSEYFYILFNCLCSRRSLWYKLGQWLTKKIILASIIFRRCHRVCIEFSCRFLLLGWLWDICYCDRNSL